MPRKYAHGRTVLWTKKVIQEQHMNDCKFTSTKEDQVNICFAYLSYIGETIRQKEKAKAARQILCDIKAAILQTPTLCKTSILCNSNAADWNIVWGPAIYTFPEAEYQDSGMFVAQQISCPTSYVVAIRGTNPKALSDWLVEDFDVFFMTSWEAARGAKISNATHEGIKLLLRLRPDKGMPGNEMTIEKFLGEIANNKNPGKSINLRFTGHSLGGALAPTLALYFKERQGKASTDCGWDQEANANVTCTAFAGATAGNAEFAKYSNDQFAANPCRRIHNCNDIVPHAWAIHSLAKLRNLYKNKGIEMNFLERFILEIGLIIERIKGLFGSGYTQIGTSHSFCFSVNKSTGKSYLAQAEYQHHCAYPLTILGQCNGKKLIDQVNNYNDPKKSKSCCPPKEIA